MLALLLGLTIVQKWCLHSCFLNREHIAAHEQEDDASEELMGVDERYLRRLPACGSVGGRWEGQEGR